VPPAAFSGTAASSESPMIDRIQEVQINIDSPSGSVFRGFSKAVVIKARKQVIIEFRRNWVNYMSLSEHAELTVEIGTGCRRFLLKNAMARLDKDKLSILAERITAQETP
jgi:hypothetical protein